MKTLEKISNFIGRYMAVIIPVVLGLCINRFLGKYTEPFVKILPMISVISICLIIMAVVSHNAEKIMSTGAVIFAVVVLHNLMGPCSQYGITYQELYWPTYIDDYECPMEQRLWLKNNYE